MVLIRYRKNNFRHTMFEFNTLLTFPFSWYYCNLNWQMARSENWDFFDRHCKSKYLLISRTSPLFWSLINKITDTLFCISVSRSYIILILTLFLSCYLFSSKYFSSKPFQKKKCNVWHLFERFFWNLHFFWACGIWSLYQADVVFS